MARSHESTNLHSMSRLKESAYGTPVAWASGAYKRILSGVDRWNFSNAIENDAGEGNGSDLPENEWNTTNDAAKSFPSRFNYQDVGRWIQMTLGNASVSGTTPDFLHEFTPLAGAGGQLPSRTFLERSNGAIYRIPGVCVNQLTISGAAGEENKGMLQMSAEVMGSGRFSINPASYADPGNSTGLVYGYNHTGRVTLAGSDSEDLSLSCNLANWEWSFNNNFQSFYDNCDNVEFTPGTPKSGIVKTALLLGQRVYTFKFTAYQEAGNPALGWLKNKAIINIETVAESTETDVATFSLSIQHTRGSVGNVERTAMKGYNVVTGTVNLLSSNGVIPLSIFVANDVPSYVS